nr:hypothetical protein [Tanacetum cinerariifolium]
MPITTVKEKAQIRVDVKAKSTLMMGIPNEHQLKFNSIKDAKQLLETVEKRFGEKLSQEDVNQKLLRSLSPECNTHAVMWRNKADLDTMSMGDLYNNLKAQPSSPQLVHEDLEQIHPDDMEEIDLRCQMAMLTMRARRECRAPRNQNNKHKESSRRSVPVETTNFTALVSCDGLGGYDWGDQAVRKNNDALIIKEWVSDDEEENVS